MGRASRTHYACLIGFPRFQTAACFTLGTGLALAACSGGEQAPAPPGFDGAAPDAGNPPPSDGGPPPPPGRSDAGLVLPPADVTVTLPYEEPEVAEPLQVPATPRRLDVCFSVDTTQSFAEEIDAMQAGLDGLVDDLEDAVAEVSFGVTRFEDFPVEPFGVEGDRPYQLLSPVTSDRSRATRAIGELDRPLGLGGDAPEAGAEALYQIATGEGREAPFPIGPFDGDAAPGGGALGGVGFREDALRVVVHVTDAPTHAPVDYGDVVPGTHSLADAANALLALEARVVGIASHAVDGSVPARSDLDWIARATGAVMPPVDGACPTGVGGSDRPPEDGSCPLVFEVASDGSGLSSALTDGILSLLSTVAYDEVYATVESNRLGFVQAVEAVAAEPPPGAPAPDRADRRPVDGIDDTFVDVAAGTELELAIRLRNDTIPEQDYDQAFRVRVTVHGDGQTLAERVVRVVVPAGGG